VTQFIVDMVDPKLGETVLDPACGTGGFLGLRHRARAQQYVKSAAQEARLQESIRGSREEAMRTCCARPNMILHEIEVAFQHPPRKRPGPSLRDYGPKGSRGRDRHHPPLAAWKKTGWRNSVPTDLPYSEETADLFWCC